MPDFLAAVELDTLAKTKAKAHPEMSTDVLVIGAGPTGLACAIEAQKVGFKVIVLDKGCLVNSLFHYPANMSFFTTPELLEIGDIPFTRPSRSRRAKRRLSITARWPSTTMLDVRQYECGEDRDGRRRNFSITAPTGRPTA